MRWHIPIYEIYSAEEQEKIFPKSSVASINNIIGECEEIMKNPHETDVEPLVEFE